tara:strand:- start:810 stop:1049 length:240 start_codon:yes stop_codon:yes gene_type:complete
MNKIILEPFDSNYDDHYYVRVICGDFDHVIAIVNLTLTVTTNDKLKKFGRMTEAELWAEFNSIIKDREQLKKEAEKDVN